MVNCWHQSPPQARKVLAHGVLCTSGRSVLCRMGHTRHTRSHGPFCVKLGPLSLLGAGWGGLQAGMVVGGIVQHEGREDGWGGQWVGRCLHM